MPKKHTYTHFREIVYVGKNHEIIVRFACTAWRTEIKVTYVACRYCQGRRGVPAAALLPEINLNGVRTGASPLASPQLLRILGLRALAPAAVRAPIPLLMRVTEFSSAPLTVAEANTGCGRAHAGVAAKAALSLGVRAGVGAGCCGERSRRRAAAVAVAVESRRGDACANERPEAASSATTVVCAWGRAR